MEDSKLQIEQYLRGEMDSETAAAFERLLDEDPALRAQMESMRSAVLLGEIGLDPDGVFEVSDPIAENTVPEPEETASEKPFYQRNPMLLWLLLLAFGLIGAGLYLRFKKPTSLFANNFDLPESLKADFDSRAAGSGTVEDSAATRDGMCTVMIEEADILYKNGDYEQAQLPLLMAVANEEGEFMAGPCLSDGCFYLGLISMQLGDPGTAIQCFAKIEDYDRYGEDIQWYMALAFVQIAEKDPLEKEVATRALDRILKSAQPADRKEKALKMLEKLQNTL